jgi:hypothetical protein
LTCYRSRLFPTWRNGRSGRDSISKGLDRVIVSEILLNDVGRFRSWVEIPFVSDHAPVAVQLEFQPFSMAYPFKLNPSWLNEVDLRLLFVMFGGILVF